jgi:exodeoxyribonuclease III
MIISSWNVNGIRASVKKGFWDNLKELNCDILCMQELKSGDAHMEEIFGAEYNPQNQELLIDSNEFVGVWHTCRVKSGYSGTGIILKKSIFKEWQITEVIKNLGEEEYDAEGRLIGLKMVKGDNKLIILNGYYPNGGRDWRIAYKLEFYRRVYIAVKEWIAEGWNIVMTGDFNTTLKDIDLARPKENRKSTGCLPEERIALNWFVGDEFFEPDQLIIINPDYNYIGELKLESLSMLEALRYFYPEKEGVYTYWDQITRARERNTGWRIDMFIFNKKLLPFTKDTLVHDKIMGSDHCPISLIISY